MVDCFLPIFRTFFREYFLGKSHASNNNHMEECRDKVVNYQPINPRISVNLPVKLTRKPHRGGAWGASRGLPRPMAPPGRGARYGREEGSQGVGPHGPPLTLGFILVSFTGKFTDILGLIA